MAYLLKISIKFEAQNPKLKTNPKLQTQNPKLLILDLGFGIWNLFGILPFGFWTLS
jgi:hypothetical protein